MIPDIGIRIIPRPEWDASVLKPGWD